jgi:hypothetical protein
LIYWRFSRVPELAGLDESLTKQIKKRSASRLKWKTTFILVGLVLSLVYVIRPWLHSNFSIYMYGFDVVVEFFIAMTIYVVFLLPIQIHLHRKDIRSHEHDCL